MTTKSDDNARQTRVGLYVDAFNVYYGAREICGRYEPGWKWLDLPALAMDLIDTELWPRPVLKRFFYCTAHRGRDGRSRSDDQQAYIKALQHQYPFMRVAWGLYRPRIKQGILVDREKPNSRVDLGSEKVPHWFPSHKIHENQGRREILVSVSSFEEKGSDVNVASHLLLDVVQKKIDAAIVISNDSDLQFPLVVARDHVHVGTVNPTKAAVPARLRGEADSGAGKHWWRKLRKKDFFDHQLPEICGSNIRPDDW